MIKTNVNPGIYYIEVTALAGPGKYDPAYLKVIGRYFIYRI